jgi:peptide/nickel transport system substrate-binding protein
MRVIAAVVVLLLGLTACAVGSSSSSDFNAAVGKVVAPSDARGGVVHLADSGDWDSLDPAESYYAYEMNFARLYGRSLVAFAPSPGADGTKLVPDLASSLGVASDDARTWTYHLRSGVKFEDGVVVTSKDVKYAVERSLDKSTFPAGPSYFNQYLDLQGYTSPYEDPSPDRLGLRAIETPDDSTIVFHLRQPFAAFDDVVMMPPTIPVERARDTGVDYKKHPLSTGPYQFGTINPGRNFTLVRNPHWDPATDPLRRALPDEFDVSLNVNADDIDQRLIAGDLDLDVTGLGVQAAAQGRILGDPRLKSNADNAASAREWYTTLNPDVAPLDNIHCRQAVEYATDHNSLLAAFGGPFGGDIVTNLQPPIMPGVRTFDPYPSANHAGDITAARSQLSQCGHPAGFATTIAYRAEWPREKAAAEAMQQSLSRVGIKLTLKSFPQADYLRLYVGKPAYAAANGLGLAVFGWQADWPDGFGYLNQLVDSRAIHPEGGNANLGVRDPAIDALVDQANRTPSAAARADIWNEVDRRVMADAYIVPGIQAKGLLYRPTRLSNVFVTDAYGMYDYIALGVKR